MEKSVETIADKPMYTRIPTVRLSIDNYLRDQLIAEGVDPDTIVFETEELPRDSRCCKKILVKAHGTTTEEEGS